MKTSHFVDEVVALFSQALSSLVGDPKAQRFATFGAVGCLLGGFLGELWMWSASRPAEPRAQDICLLVDCSASMQGQNHVEVQRAAIAFVKRQNVERDRISLVTFGRDARIEVPLTHDRNALEKALESLELRGNTAMDLGLIKARETLPLDTGSNPAVANPIILLFTDGKPNQPGPTIQASQTCRDAGCRLIAIATGDADITLLNVLTNDPTQVFSVQSGDFERGFREAEKIIQRASLVQSGSALGLVGMTVVIAGWTSLITIGAALALIVGQNSYLHRPLLSASEGLAGGIGGLLAGTMAGAVGQLLFSLMGGDNASQSVAVLSWLQASLARLFGWLILGGLVGRGMSEFVPNLEPRRAMLGGAIGGLIGALAFIMLSIVGDASGRLAGAALLGAFLGLLIAIVESMSRQFFLEVNYGGNERVLVNLGTNPVRVGGDGRQCAVFARGARALALQYVLDGDQVICTDYATEKKSSVSPGEQRIVGGVSITLRSQASSSSDGVTAASIGAATTPSKTQSVPPPPPVKNPAAKPPVKSESAPAAATTIAVSPPQSAKLPPPPSKPKK